MDKLKEKSASVKAEEEIEAVIRRESEAALSRFRAGDFTARLNARLASPLARRPFIRFRRPLLVPALGLLTLAAAALLVFFLPGREDRRLEAGFRFMTEALTRSDLFRVMDEPEASERPAVGGGTEAGNFIQLLLRAAAGSEPGSDAASPAGSSEPIRPLFSPGERLNILYGDNAILKVLTMISNQKEG